MIRLTTSVLTFVLVVGCANKEVNTQSQNSGFQKEQLDQTADKVDQTKSDSKAFEDKFRQKMYGHDVVVWNSASISSTSRCVTLSADGSTCSALVQDALDSEKVESITGAKCSFEFSTALDTVVSLNCNRSDGKPCFGGVEGFNTLGSISLAGGLKSAHLEQVVFSNESSGANLKILEAGTCAKKIE